MVGRTRQRHKAAGGLGIRHLEEEKGLGFWFAVSVGLQRWEVELDKAPGFGESRRGWAWTAVQSGLWPYLRPAGGRSSRP